MKRVIMSILTVFMTVFLLAQAPQKMSYQAVVRNSAGELVKSHAIGMKVSILQGSETGTAVYTETLTPSTNANGLVTVEIGAEGVDWSAGPYFVKTETDPEGGTNYAVVGTSKLLSVPYALYAKEAENGFSGDYNDLNNTPVLFDGNYNSLTNKPSLFDGAWVSLTGKPTTLAGYGIIDAMSVTHPANEITEINKQYWNVSHSWGNHADAGYLKTFTELDPYFNQWFSLTGQDDARPYDYMGWDGTKWVRTRNTFAELNHNHPVTDNMGTVGFMSSMDKFKLDRFPLPVPTEPGRVLISDGNDWLSIGQDFFARGNHGHAVATDLIDGFISKEDKFFLTRLPRPIIGTSGHVMFSTGDDWETVSSDMWSLSNHSHADVNPSSSGFMTVQDKTKLDNFNTVGQTTGDILMFNGLMWVVKSNAFSLPSHTHVDVTPTVSGFMSGADKTKLDGITPADGSETKITGNPGITIKGNGTVATPYTVTVTQHTVGETYGGGIVFYVYDNGQHGLIAATADATVGGNPNLYWIWNAQPFTAGAGANGVRGGISNTSAMMAYQMRFTYSYPLMTTYSAAVGVSMYFALDAQGVRYADWYIPSANEMLFAVQSGVVPNLNTGSPYWTSTEALDNPNYANAIYQGSIMVQPKNNPFRVRAIRSF